LAQKNGDRKPIAVGVAAGVSSSRTFDAVTGWVSNLISEVGGNPASVQNESYLFDLVGNVTQRQNNRLGLTEDF